MTGQLTTTAHGVIESATATLYDWLGLSASTGDEASGSIDPLVGRTFGDLLKPGARVVWLTHHVPRLEAVGRLDGVAVDLVRSDGSLLPVLLTATLVDTVGAPEVRITFVNASERRAYERDLLFARLAAERAEWRMTALQRVTEVCAVAGDEDELLAEVTRAVTVSFEAERTRIWLPTAESKVLVATDDGEAEFPEVVGAAWESGEHELPDAVGSGKRRCAAVSFGHLGAQLGILEVQLPGTWRGNTADTEVLGVMGTMLGQSLVRVRLHRRLERLAQFDALTGLPNRNLFDERLEQAIARAEFSGVSIALLYADLNGFKSVNDRHGHAVGDQVLRVCAERMADNVRFGDTVARIGGDEFVILCEDADETVAVEVADRLRAALTRDLSVEVPVLAPNFRLGVSVGMAVGRRPFGPDAAATLVAAGDAAMYDAKRAPGEL